MTSLTTSPAMNPTTPIDTGITLTPEEVIAYLIEQYRDAGKIGFDAEWKPERSAELVSISTNFANLSPTKQTFHGQTTNVFEEMMEGAERWQRENSRAELLASNLPALKTARAIVDQRLLAAGIDKESLDGIRKTTLHGRVRKLYDLEHPRIQSSRRMELFLKRCSGNKIQAIYLPMKAPLAEITDILYHLSFVVDSKGDPVHHGHGAWMYQLMNQAYKVLSGRKPLSVDADYQDMIKKLSEPGSVTPSAVLFQESALLSLESIPEKRGVERNKDSDNFPDEDWELNFKPLDWNALIQRRLEMVKLAK